MTTNKVLFDTYRFRRRGFNAIDALRLAREDIAAGRGKLYGYTAPGGMRGGAPFSLRGDSRSTFGHSHDRMTWFERPGDYMRLVGFADEICKSIRHCGWYSDDDGDGEKLRGVVYQLVTRRGKLQFMYGYADPVNDGPAALSLDIADDKEDAARWADQIAEIAAECQRDYNRAWQAGRRFDEAGDEVKSLHASCLALIRETKDACDALTNYSAIKTTIRSQINGYVKKIRRLRKERAELESNYGRQPGFVE